MQLQPRQQHTDQHSLSVISVPHWINYGLRPARGMRPIIERLQLALVQAHAGALGLNHGQRLGRVSTESEVDEAGTHDQRAADTQASVSTAQLSQQAARL